MMAAALQYSSHLLNQQVIAAWGGYVDSCQALAMQSVPPVLDRLIAVQ
jgi:hypothetical protein